MEQLVQSIFSYEYAGMNCLSAAFSTMRAYSDQTGEYPDSSIALFNEIESSFIYLLQLAEQYNIDMDRVINHTDEAGQSLLYPASVYSENISFELLKRNVKVNRIDNQFKTPLFIVR